MNHLPKITIEFIEHKDQRYPTVGDWIINPDGSVTVFVSKMSDWHYELAIAIHEVVELFDCIQRGISQETVDQFDMAFETLRTQHPGIIDHVEPGSMPTAPYHASHELASLVEKQYVLGNGINWDVYEEVINHL